MTQKKPMKRRYIRVPLQYVVVNRTRIELLKKQLKLRLQDKELDAHELAMLADVQKTCRPFIRKARQIQLMGMKRKLRRDLSKK